MIGSELRMRRHSAGLTGHLVCKKAGIPRTRLSEIEREYVEPTIDECKRIDQAITALIEARSQLAQIAAQVGWPVAF
jgi:transcriptional regulator with XRE-family HTH domain